MDFLKLRAANFLTLGDTGDLPLKDRGLIAIMGENRDDSSAKSNGAGKSSVADALCWALFGTTARGESGDAVINRKVKKGTFVSVIIQDGETIYDIRRHRKDKQFKNATTITVWNPAELFHNGGAGERIEKGTEREIQLQINDIVGCNYDVFKAAIYAGQEDMPDLPKMTDKPLKMLIEKAAGIERLEKAYEIAGKKRDAAVAAVETTVRQIENAEAHIVNWKVSLQQATQQHAAFEAARPDVQKGWVDRQNAIADAMKQNAATYHGMNEAGLIAERDTLQAALADHNKLLANRDALVRAANDARHAVTVAQTNLNAIHGQMLTAADAIKNAPEAMAKPCAECGKPHTPDELDTFVTHQKTKAVELAGQFRTKKTEVDDLTAKHAAASQEAADFAATIPDVSATSARVATLNAQIMSAQSLKTTLLQQKQEWTRCGNEAQGALSAVNPAQSAIDMGKQQVEALEKQVADAKAAQAPLLQAVEVAEVVVKVFGPAGVRAHILDTVTPFLNDRTSDYLSALSDGNISAIWSTLAATSKGDTREKFNIEVTNAEGADSFGGLSGGEKRKVRLSTMLALQDLVASRAAKPINIWIGDEVDDALDVSGLERLMTILEQKAREKGTVLIISHESLSDWCDQTATITKEGGISTVSGALCG